MEASITPQSPGCRSHLRSGEAELAQEQQTAASAKAERLQASVADIRGRVEQRRGEAGSQRSAGAIVDALMAARQAGTLPGVHGRLGAWLAAFRMAVVSCQCRGRLAQILKVDSEL